MISRAQLTFGFLAALLALTPLTRVQAAERVVTLAPHLAELVCAVGACKQLVGSVSHTDYPEQARSVTHIGDAHAVNPEVVLSLEPTLVLAWDGGTPARTMLQLEKFGLRVEAIRVRTLDDVGLALFRVGALLGREDHACKVEAEYRSRIDALRAQHADLPPIDVMYQIDPEPAFTINRDSPISEAIELCGARNIFADYPQLAGPVGREAVLARDPDAIIFGKQDDVDGIHHGWARFPRLRANRADNLIAIDASTLARATPRMAEGVAELCHALNAARRRLHELDR